MSFWVRLESASEQAVTTLFALSSEADGSGVALTVDQGNNLNLRVGDSGLIAKGSRPACACAAERYGSTPGTTCS